MEASQCIRQSVGTFFFLQIITNFSYCKLYITVQVIFLLQIIVVQVITFNHQGRLGPCVLSDLLKMRRVSCISSAKEVFKKALLVVFYY